MHHDPRATYVANTVSTANPATLVILLCDRLVLDVQRALEAQQGDDRAKAHQELVHAQEIVAELRSSLNVDRWEGGPGLASLYDWLFTALVRANTTRDVATTSSCLDVATQLADTWRQAALGASQAS